MLDEASSTFAVSSCWFYHPVMSVLTMLHLPSHHVVLNSYILFSLIVSPLPFLFPSFFISSWCTSLICIFNTFGLSTINLFSISFTENNRLLILYFFLNDSNERGGGTVSKQRVGYTQPVDTKNRYLHLPIH